ncbi:MAG: hypothetical protein ACPLXP_02175 [Microgenomates group bacterium]
MKINKTKEDIQPILLKIIKESGSPSEQLVDFGFALIEPAAGFWALAGMLTSFLIKPVILALTNERLIIVETDIFLNPKTYLTFPLSQLKCVEFKKGFLNIILVLLFPDGKKEKYKFFKNDRYGWNTVAEKIAAVLPKA